MSSVLSASASHAKYISIQTRRKARCKPKQIRFVRVRFIGLAVKCIRLALDGNDSASAAVDVVDVDSTPETGISHDDPVYGLCCV